MAEKPMSANLAFRARAQNYLTYYTAVAISRGQ